MNRLPLEVQTLYAELMERLSARDARRSIGHVPGSFVTKEVKGERYAYFQYSDPGSVKRQVYVGRKAAVLDAVMPAGVASAIRAPQFSVGDNTSGTWLDRASAASGPRPRRERR